VKRLILSAVQIVIAANVFGQGQIVFDNLGNGNMSVTATSEGLFWISTGGNPVLIAQDFNAALYGGTDSSSLALLSTVLLSNGTGIGDNPFPGYFREPSGNAYTIQGAVNSAFFRVEAWTGNFNSYAAAVAGGAAAAQSPVFLNPVDVPPGNPLSLEGMPAMVLSVPEPSTLSLLLLGALSFPLLRALRTKLPNPPRDLSAVHLATAVLKYPLAAP
jgi:hypothetical protein